MTVFRYRLIFNLPAYATWLIAVIASYSSSVVLGVVSGLMTGFWLGISVAILFALPNSSRTVPGAGVWSHPVVVQVLALGSGYIAYLGMSPFQGGTVPFPLSSNDWHPLMAMSGATGFIYIFYFLHGKMAPLYKE